MRFSKRPSCDLDGDNKVGCFQKARALVAAGEDVTKLPFGEHNMPIASSMLAARHHAAPAGHADYAEMAGPDALRGGPQA